MNERKTVYVSRYGHGAFERIKLTGIYVRVSTSKSKQPQSLSTQIDKLVEYVDRDLTKKLVGIYVDIGSGRDVASRKELKRLIEDCKSGKIETIVTKSVSRFGRNTAETLKLCRDLKEYDVDVYFHSDNLHSISPNGELTLTLTMAVAESSSVAKSHDTKWGIEKRAADSDAGIYSRPCYGYRKDEDGKLTIVESEADIIRKVFDLYLDGYGFARIQKYLEQNEIASPTGSKTWPKRTIEKLLKNEKYCGDVILYKTYTAEYPSTKRITNEGQKQKLKVENHHPAIISKELFNQVQLCIQNRKKTQNNVG